MSFPIPRNSVFAPLDKRERTHAAEADPPPEESASAAGQPMAADPNRVLTLVDVAALLQVSTRTLKRWETVDPDFPPPFKMGTRSRNWLYGQIRAYILRKAGRV